jgi:hydroxyacylglutathione hydrolase
MSTKKITINIQVFCAHEYTQANGRFAASIEGGNSTELAARLTEIEQLRAQGIPTIPTTMALEKATNPFLRPEAIAKLWGFKNATAGETTAGGENASKASFDRNVTVFAELRRKKDNF